MWPPQGLPPEEQKEEGTSYDSLLSKLTRQVTKLEEGLKCELCDRTFASPCTSPTTNQHLCKECYLFRRGGTLPSNPTKTIPNYMVPNPQLERLVTNLAKLKEQLSLNYQVSWEPLSTHSQLNTTITQVTDPTLFTQLLTKENLTQDLVDSGSELNLEILDTTSFSEVPIITTLPYHSPELTLPYQPPELTLPYQPPELTLPYQPPELTLPYQPPELTLPYHTPDLPTHDTSLTRDHSYPPLSPVTSRVIPFPRTATIITQPIQDTTITSLLSVESDPMTIQEKTQLLSSPVLNSPILIKLTSHQTISEEKRRIPELEHHFLPPIKISCLSSNATTIQPYHQDDNLNPSPSHSASPPAHLTILPEVMIPTTEPVLSNPTPSPLEHGPPSPKWDRKWDLDPPLITHPIPSPPIKSYKPHKGIKAVKIATTGFNPSQKKELTLLLFDLNQVHLKVTQTDLKQATHLLICPSQETTACQMGVRTVKYLHALIKNLPILDRTWLSDSLHRGRWLDEGDYYLHGTSAYGPLLHPIIPLPDRTRMPSLLRGFTFYFKGTAVGSIPSKVDLVGLVKAAGGKVLTTLPSRLTQPPDLHLDDVIPPPQYLIRRSSLGRPYLQPVIGSSSSHRSKREPPPPYHPKGTWQPAYGLCYLDSPGLPPLALRFPTPHYPVTITLDSPSPVTTTTSPLPFLPSPPDPTSQSAPSSWLLDCLSARTLLPLPTTL